LSVSDSASNSPQTANLTGTGKQSFAVALIPSHATYKSQTIGTTSAAKTFTLSNQENVTITDIVISTTGVSVEKVPQLMLAAVQGSGYKQARVPDAAVHRYIRRPAAHDGTPIPLRRVVLLFPPGRSGS
jgi:hypothetical protein